MQVPLAQPQGRETSGSISEIEENAGHPAFSAVLRMFSSVYKTAFPIRTTFVACK